jgi:dephospho-CoA kinase
VLRVGLTGGIAAGKSTVAAELAALGAVVIDADSIARGVLAPGQPAVAEVVEAFGDAALSAPGVIDRAALGRIVFADPAARARLEAITHPRVRAATARRFSEAPADAVVVHDVPLLVELGMAGQYDLVVVVHAPEAERVARLVRERGMTVHDAWARVRAQATDDQRLAAADVVLDNTGAPEDLVQAVRDLWSERLAPAAGVKRP